MKYIPSQVVFFFQSRVAKSNIRALIKFLLVLLFMITVYSFAFQYIKLYEGEKYTLVTGFYWTLTTMSTLGFGDITFTSDLGRLFSILVMMSGVVFLLVMLPFTFIQFFYAPWLEAQDKARTPRELPQDTTGHVLLTNSDPLSTALVEKLKQYKYPYAIIVPDQHQALELYDQGYKIILGDLDDIETYRKTRADKAALVFFNNDDQTNTNAVFTLRELSKEPPVISSAEVSESADILELAGSSQVYQFTRMLGRSLARRVLGVSMHANIIGRFNELLIAEAPAMRTPLVGKTLLQSKLRESTGVNVVGIWERGKFQSPLPETTITSDSVLVLAGSEKQLEKYDDIYGIYNLSFAPVLILGGGRVGQAAAQALQENEIEYRIVEKSPRVAGNRENYIQGNAADLNILKKAGIDKTPSIIVTTNNDDLNIYLTIYCRKLMPEVQIITRATRERNIPKLHHAGADLVMSYASMGANTIINYLRGDNVMMVAEGLDIFKEKAPEALVGKTLAESEIRKKTGCSVIAIEFQGAININPGPDTIINKDEELILIGTTEAESKFLSSFIKK
ncbi:potassium channel family protein [Desulfonatronovibrio hydrogenovorans]|uniref:potassium channel family protein n=1 Tax=Desulfonatronovibrio hydrogenovorans TaxID=53245 RepID=UPI00048D1574|nr:NAD-binding protein [Desulfonatronovibrio hydrogenovorans]